MAIETNTDGELVSMAVAPLGEEAGRRCGGRWELAAEALLRAAADCAIHLGCSSDAFARNAARCLSDARAKTAELARRPIVSDGEARELFRRLSGRLPGSGRD